MVGGVEIAVELNLEGIEEALRDLHERIKSTSFYVDVKYNATQQGSTKQRQSQPTSRNQVQPFADTSNRLSNSMNAIGNINSKGFESLQRDLRNLSSTIDKSSSNTLSTSSNKLSNISNILEKGHRDISSVFQKTSEQSSKQISSQVKKSARYSLIKEVKTAATQGLIYNTFFQEGIDMMGNKITSSVLKKAGRAVRKAEVPLRLMGMGNVPDNFDKVQKRADEYAGQVTQLIKTPEFEKNAKEAFETIKLAFVSATSDSSDFSGSIHELAVESRQSFSQLKSAINGVLDGLTSTASQVEGFAQLDELSNSFSDIVDATEENRDDIDNFLTAYRVKLKEFLSQLQDGGNEDLDLSSVSKVADGLSVTLNRLNRSIKQRSEKTGTAFVTLEQAIQKTSEVFSKTVSETRKKQIGNTIQEVVDKKETAQGFNTEGKPGVVVYLPGFGIEPDEALQKKIESLTDTENQALNIRTSPELDRDSKLKGGKNDNALQYAYRALNTNLTNYSSLTTEVIADIVKTVEDNPDLKDVTIVAHSLGGAIAREIIEVVNTIDLVKIIKDSLGRDITISGLSYGTATMGLAKPVENAPDPNNPNFESVLSLDDAVAKVGLFNQGSVRFPGLPLESTGGGLPGHSTDEYLGGQTIREYMQSKVQVGVAPKAKDASSLPDSQAGKVLEEYKKELEKRTIPKLKDIVFQLGINQQKNKALYIEKILERSTEEIDNAILEAEGRKDMAPVTKEKEAYILDLLHGMESSVDKQLHGMKSIPADDTEKGLKIIEEAQKAIEAIKKEQRENVFSPSASKQLQGYLLHLRGNIKRVSKMLPAGTLEKAATKKQEALFKKESGVLFNSLAEVGKNITQGLESGIDIDEVADMGMLIGDTITEATKDSLDIHSPAGEFEEIGENIGAGLIQGLSSLDEVAVVIQDKMAAILEQTNRQIEKNKEMFTLASYLRDVDAKRSSNLSADINSLTSNFDPAEIEKEIVEKEEQYGRNNKGIPSLSDLSQYVEKKNVIPSLSQVSNSLKKREPLPTALTEPGPDVIFPPFKEKMASGVPTLKEVANILIQRKASDDVRLAKTLETTFKLLYNRNKQRTQDPDYLPGDYFGSKEVDASMKEIEKTFAGVKRKEEEIRMANEEAKKELVTFTGIVSATNQILEKKTKQSLQNADRNRARQSAGFVEKTRSRAGIESMLGLEESPDFEEIAKEIEEKEKEWLSDIAKLSDQEMDAKWEKKGVLKEQSQTPVKPQGLTGMPAIMMALKQIEKQRTKAFAESLTRELKDWDKAIEDLEFTQILEDANSIVEEISDAFASVVIDNSPVLESLDDTTEAIEKSWDEIAWVFNRVGSTIANIDTKPLLELEDGLASADINTLTDSLIQIVDGYKEAQEETSVVAQSNPTKKTKGRPSFTEILASNSAYIDVWAKTKKGKRDREKLNSVEKRSPLSRLLSQMDDETLAHTREVSKNGKKISLKFLPDRKFFKQYEEKLKAIGITDRKEMFDIFQDVRAGNVEWLANHIQNSMLDVKSNNPEDYKKKIKELLKQAKVTKDEAEGIIEFYMNSGSWSLNRQEKMKNTKGNPLDAVAQFYAENNERLNEIKKQKSLTRRAGRAAGNLVKNRVGKPLATFGKNRIVDPLANTRAGQKIKEIREDRKKKNSFEEIDPSKLSPKKVEEYLRKYADRTSELAPEKLAELTEIAEEYLADKFMKELNLDAIWDKIMIDKMDFKDLETVQFAYLMQSKQSAEVAKKTFESSKTYDAIVKGFDSFVHEWMPNKVKETLKKAEEFFSKTEGGRKLVDGAKGLYKTLDNLQVISAVKGAGKLLGASFSKIYQGLFMIIAPITGLGIVLASQAAVIAREVVESPLLRAFGSDIMDVLGTIFGTIAGDFRKLSLMFLNTPFGKVLGETATGIFSFLKESAKGIKEFIAKPDFIKLFGGMESIKENIRNSPIVKYVAESPVGQYVKKRARPAVKFVRDSAWGSEDKPGFFRPAQIWSVAKIALAAKLISDYKDELIEMGMASIKVAQEFQVLGKTLEFITGGTKEGAKKLEELRNLANSVGVEITPLVGSYNQLAAATRLTPMEGQVTDDMIEGIVRMGATFGLSTEQIHGSINAIAQIAGKGVVSAEELRGQLAERIPGAFQSAARAMKMTEKELYQLMSTGKLTANEFITLFGPQLIKESAFAEGQVTTSIANLNRLKNQVTEVQLAAGKALTPLFDFGVRIASAGIEAGKFVFGLLKMTVVNQLVSGLIGAWPLAKFVGTVALLKTLAESISLFGAGVTLYLTTTGISLKAFLMGIAKSIAVIMAQALVAWAVMSQATKMIEAWEMQFSNKHSVYKVWADNVESNAKRVKKAMESVSSKDVKVVLPEVENRNKITKTGNWITDFLSINPDQAQHVIKRLNAKRKRQGKAEMTPEEVDAMYENFNTGNIVNISGVQEATYRDMIMRGERQEQSDSLFFKPIQSALESYNISGAGVLKTISDIDKQISLLEAKKAILDPADVNTAKAISEEIKGLKKNKEDLINPLDASEQGLKQSLKDNEKIISDYEKALINQSSPDEKIRKEADALLQKPGMDKSSISLVRAEIANTKKTLDSYAEATAKSGAISNTKKLAMALMELSVAFSSVEKRIGDIHTGKLKGIAQAQVKGFSTDRFNTTNTGLRTAEENYNHTQRMLKERKSTIAKLEEDLALNPTKASADQLIANQEAIKKRKLTSEEITQLAELYGGEGQEKLKQALDSEAALREEKLKNLDLEKQSVEDIYNIRQARQAHYLAIYEDAIDEIKQLDQRNLSNATTGANNVLARGLRSDLGAEDAFNVKTTGMQYIKVQKDIENNALAMKSLKQAYFEGKESLEQYTTKSRALLTEDAQLKQQLVEQEIAYIRAVSQARMNALQRIKESRDANTEIANSGRTKAITQNSISKFRTDEFLTNNESLAQAKNGLVEIQNQLKNTKSELSELEEAYAGGKGPLLLNEYIQKKRQLLITQAQQESQLATAEMARMRAIEDYRLAMLDRMRDVSNNKNAILNAEALTQLAQSQMSGQVSDSTINRQSAEIGLDNAKKAVDVAQDSLSQVQKAFAKKELSAEKYQERLRTINLEIAQANQSVAEQELAVLKANEQEKISIIEKSLEKQDRLNKLNAIKAKINNPEQLSGMLVSGGTSDLTSSIFNNQETNTGQDQQITSLTSKLVGMKGILNPTKDLQDKILATEQELNEAVLTKRLNLLSQSLEYKKQMLNATQLENKAIENQLNVIDSQHKIQQALVEITKKRLENEIVSMERVKTLSDEIGSSSIESVKSRSQFDDAITSKRLKTLDIELKANVRNLEIEQQREILGQRKAENESRLAVLQAKNTALIANQSGNSDAIALAQQQLSLANESLSVVLQQGHSMNQLHDTQRTKLALEHKGTLAAEKYAKIQDTINSKLKTANSYLDKQKERLDSINELNKAINSSRTNVLEKRGGIIDRGIDLFDQINGTEKVTDPTENPILMKELQEQLKANTGIDSLKNIDIKKMYSERLRLEETLANQKMDSLLAEQNMQKTLLQIEFDKLQLQGEALLLQAKMLALQAKGTENEADANQAVKDATSNLTGIADRRKSAESALGVNQSMERYNQEIDNANAINETRRRSAEAGYKPEGDPAKYPGTPRFAGKNVDELLAGEPKRFGYAPSFDLNREVEAMLKGGSTDNLFRNIAQDVTPGKIDIANIPETQEATYQPLDLNNELLIDANDATRKNTTAMQDLITALKSVVVPEGQPSQNTTPKATPEYANSPAGPGRPTGPGTQQNTTNVNYGGVTIISSDPTGDARKVLTDLAKANKNRF